MYNSSYLCNDFLSSVFFITTISIGYNHCEDTPCVSQLDVVMIINFYLNGCMLLVEPINVDMNPTGCDCYCNNTVFLYV